MAARACPAASSRPKSEPAVMRCGRALALALVIASPLEAAERRYATDEEAEAWRAVGLVDWRGNSRCTGALIRPDVVLTAAHCVADAASRTVAAPSAVKFIAGRKGDYNIGVVGAKSISVHPGYFAAGARYDERRIRLDVARITLVRPIPDVDAFRVAYTPGVGAEVALLSYSQNRQSRLSIQSPCRIRDRKTEFLELDCTSSPGASGAPYVTIGLDGTPRLVGVNSGRRTRGASPTALALAFDHLRDFIGPSGGRAGGSADNAAKRLAPAASGTRLPGGSKPGARIGKRAP